MEPNQNQQQPEIQLPISELAQGFSLFQKQIEAPFKVLGEFSLQFKETLAHGRPLTPEEREIKRKQEAEQRDRFEISRYGKILSPEERIAALRKEALERAEEKSQRHKLSAIRAEQDEAHERERAALERTKALREENKRRLDDSIVLKPSPALLEAKRVNGNLQPGEIRTLEALRQVSPHGLTVKQLAPLTKKDALADDTPRGSLDAWLHNLKEQGLARSDTDRPKKWFFVKDCES
jgi:hypothetical protein